jgi:hypothetical protein
VLSGLEYAGARFYDPLLGTFLTHDPARQFANPYSYGGGDPLNLSDPTGAYFGPAAAFLIGALIGAAASALQAADNGATGVQVLKAAAIGGAIGGASGVGLGIVGGAVEGSVPASLAFDVALTGSAVYGTYEAVRSGNSVYATLGVVASAFGLYGVANSARSFAQGANGAGGGRGGGTLEEMEQLYDAKFTPAQARQSSSWIDYFQVRAPDGDGYLTLGEAKWQWQNGQGAPVTVDATTLDFSGLRASDFPGGPGSTHAFRFQNAQDFLVHGTVTTELQAGSTISVRPDTYNFDIKPWRSGAFGRNFETVVSRYLVHGPGVPYEIQVLLTNLWVI